MKKLLAISILVLFVTSCSKTITSLTYNKDVKDKGIFYNLPKSIIKMDIKYTIYRNYDLVNGKKEYRGNSYAKIEDPVTIISIPIADPEQKYILTYKKNKSNYFFEDNYTIELSNNGQMKSLNWEIENVVPDILSNAISSGINVYKTISPAENLSEKEKYENLIKDYENVLLHLDSQLLIEIQKINLKKVKELKELQRFTLSRIDALKKANKANQKEKITKIETVYIDLEKDYKNNTFINKSIEAGISVFEVDLSSKFIGVVEETFPILSFSISNNKHKEASTADGLKYRIPKKVNFTLSMTDSEIEDGVLINSDLTIIQYGDINTVSLNAKGSKKSKTAITIDETTGLITKISNTNNSILKVSTSALKTTTEEISKVLDNNSFNKQKSEIGKEIENLELLLKKLELEHEIRELENN